MKDNYKYEIFVKYYQIDGSIKHDAFCFANEFDREDFALDIEQAYGEELISYAYSEPDWIVKGEKQLFCVCNFKG